MKSRASLLMSALGAAASLAGAAYGQSSCADVTVFEGARLIIGDGRPAIENATLVVNGAKIMHAGRSDAIQAPRNARRVNGAGKTIMPAIIDTHVHINQTLEALSQDLRRLAYFGVGTALSLGVDTQEAPFQVRDQPLPDAARLLTAGRGITAPEPGRETAPYWVTSEAQARKAVQENAARKVDIIKLWVDDRNDKFKKLTPKLYGAVIDEAHKQNLRASAHIYEREDAKGLLRAGVDAFAHSVRDRDIDDEFMTLLRQHPGLVLNPNLTSRGVPANLTWLQGILPPAELARLETRNISQPQAQVLFAIQARNLMKMSAAGVRIVLGTDTSFDFADGSTPWAAHIEMEDMAAAGLTPMQVIVAASGAAAEFLGLSSAGTLAAGKDADFLVLDANPLDDITNTRRISSVYLRGTAIDRTKYR